MIHLLRFVFCLSAALMLSLPAAARTVVDHLNRTVELPDNIDRVVVTGIYPLASALTVFLQGPQSLVGMHPLSMQAARSGVLSELYPQIKHVATNFVQGESLNIESLMALRPDVVFVKASDKNQIQLLEAARIPCVAFSTNRWNYDVMNTYRNWLDLMGRVFERPGVNLAALSKIETYQNFINARLARIPFDKRPHVLFLVAYDTRKIVTSSRRFFGEYWARSVGAKNVAGDLELESFTASINMEQILKWNPDAVFITNFTSARPSDLYMNRLHNWSSVAAVKHQAVYKMPLGLYRSYAPSADSPLTLLWLAKTLYPTEFADLDLAAETKTFYRDVFGITLTDSMAARLFPEQH